MFMPYLSTVMQKIKPKLSTYISYLATENAVKRYIVIKKDTSDNSERKHESYNIFNRRLH